MLSSRISLRFARQAESDGANLVTIGKPPVSFEANAVGVHAAEFFVPVHSITRRRFPLSWTIGSLVRKNVPSVTWNRSFSGPGAR